MKVKHPQKAQATNEYMLIIGVVIVICLIVIWLLFGSFNTNAQKQLSENKLFWNSQSVGLGDSGTDSNGDTFFLVTNNTNETITILGYNANGQRKDFAANGTRPTMQPSEKKIVFISKQDACNSEVCTISNFSLIYLSGQGLEKNSVGNDLVLARLSNVNRLDFSGTSLICANNDDVGVCSGTGTDTNWQTSWAVFDANMKATYALINSDTNIYTAQILSRDKNSFLIDINGGGFSLFNFLDGNFTRNINVDGNIVLDGVIKKGACPTGYVLVPGNSSFGTNDFCVMKYEAQKNAQKETVSLPGGLPDNNVTYYMAKESCERAGAHLITNAEWMTIARNIELQSSNWQSGSVGSGCLFGGHMDALPNSRLDAPSSDSNTYGGTLDSAGAAVCPFAAPGGNSSRRTMNLSNGEIIWDFSGNEYEWVDFICTGGIGSASYWSTVSSWSEWNTSTVTDIEVYIAGPQGSYTSSNGAGKYFGCSTTGNAPLRGGSFGSTVNGGIYSIVMSAAPTRYADGYGYRCVKN